MDQLCLLTFASAQHALRAEELLDSAGLEFDLQPVPPGLAGGCALAIACAGPLLAEVRAVLAGGGVRPQKLYGRAGAETEWREEDWEA